MSEEGLRARDDVLCVAAGQGRKGGDEMVSTFERKEKIECREEGFERRVKDERDAYARKKRV